MAPASVGPLPSQGLLGFCVPGRASRTRRILESLGLPTSYKADAWPQLLEAMRRDKKARGNLLRFIILDGLARPRVYEVPDDSILYMTYQEVTE